MPTTFEWCITVFLPLILTCVSFNLSPPPMKEGATSTSYLKLWIMYMFLDAAYSQLFHTILLVPTRWIASRLPGSVVPPLSDEKKLLQQEEQCNDASIAWPSHDAIAKLPQDWVVDDEDDKDNDVIQQEVADTNSSSKSHISNKKRKRSTRRKHNQHQSSKNDTFDDTQQPATKDHKVQHDTDNTSIVQSQPYYLNHVRGSTRIRQASIYEKLQQWSNDDIYNQIRAMQGLKSNDDTKKKRNIILISLYAKLAHIFHFVDQGLSASVSLRMLEVGGQAVLLKTIETDNSLAHRTR